MDSNLDFESIRRELNIPDGVGILEAIEIMPADERDCARSHLLSRELSAAEAARLKPGASETINCIRGKGLKIGLLTRNTIRAVELVMNSFEQLKFDAVVTRETRCGIKPDPDSVLHLCRLMGVKPHQTLCVGDFHYDIIAANRSGAVSVLMVETNIPEYASEANYIIRNLPDLIPLLDPR
ncbi:HAD family hydrolase [bacterium]|nr:HAD family hydrolase [candidate division CSSED10-310 bacterium]